MLIRLTRAPDAMPVTLDEFKAHAKIEHADEDAVLGGLLAAATEYVASELGRVLSPAEYRIEVPQWQPYVHLPLSPVREVIAVSWVGEDGVAHPLSPADWSWHRAVVRIAPGFALPAERIAAMYVDVAAGYDNLAASGAGDDPELALPPRAALAIKELAAAWAENREAVSSLDLKVVPLAIEALLRAPGLKVYR